MATVAEVMNKAARECSITPPSSWVSATTLSFMELKDFLSETVDELLDRVDWPAPIAADYAITGNGDEAYDLPIDFKRLTRDSLAVYEKTGTRRACIPVSSNGVWTVLKQDGSAGGNRYYRMAGDEEEGFSISFFDNPSSGNQISVSYITKNWLRSSGTPGAVWSDEGDTLMLPRNLISMGVIWRFRRRKGLAYTDRLNEYEAKLARAANDSRVIRSVDMTGGASRKNPFDIPVPDSIPSS